jgi:TRAP-type C4-dicarboxylate transport system substrate-binding protein
MMTMTKIALAAALAASTLAAAHAEDVLSATTALPKNLTYSVSFLKWVDRVNTQGKGVVRIDYRGGPEAIPMFEQGAAVRNGVVDMIHTPSNYYAGQVPETDAIIAGTVPPTETRKNGGFDLLNQIHQKRMNAYLLGYFEAMQNFHIYLRNPPKFKSDGMVDLAGVKLRGTPIYREFFTTLGATFVNIAPAEVYTALERGAVDGVGWPRIGLMDASWDKFLKYRLDPGFYNVDLTVLVNLDKWKKLSPQSRALLEKLAIEYEAESIRNNIEKAAEEDAELKRRRVQFVAMQPAAGRAFLDLAYKVAWDRMKGRDPTNVEALRAKFYKAQ